MPPSSSAAANLPSLGHPEVRQALAVTSRHGHLLRWGAVILLWAGLAVTILPVPSPWMAHDIPRTLLLVIEAATLVLLPGTSLVCALWPRARLDVVQAACMGVAASLALFPLLLLWASAAGIRVGPNLLRAVLVASALSLTWRVVGPRSARAVPEPADLGTLIALASIFGLALAGRLYAIWGIVYPPGADTYHHTIITEMIVQTGAIPAGYRPYAPIDGYSYHFGYHAYSAFLAMLTDLPAHRAVFWGAQFLNALTAPVLYVLVAGAAGNRIGGLFAAVIGALTCHMPATYVIWGRNPQLAGQVILPVLAGVTVALTDESGFPWRHIALCGVLLAGLALTHYRVTILYGAFALIAGCRALLSRPFSWRWLAAVGGRCGGMAILACALAAPWALRFLLGVAPMSQEAVSLNETQQLDALTWDEMVTWGLRPPLLAITALAALWSLLRRRRGWLSVMMMAWTALLLIVATPQVSGVPPGYVTYRTVIIALYLPASVVLGVALSALPDLEVTAIRRGAKAPIRSVMVPVRIVVAVMLVAWGIHEMVGVRSAPRHELVRNVDREAMAWIREHTPPDARFAVDPLFYLPWAAAGNDAGYWLPYSAGRATILPPMIYTAEGSLKYVAETNASLRWLMEAPSADELAHRLRALGAQYAYVAGPTEHSWKEHALDDRFFEVVYRLADVRVVRLRDS